jgi:hypothetical protein
LHVALFTCRYWGLVSEEEDVMVDTTYKGHVLVPNDNVVWLRKVTRWVWSNVGNKGNTRIRWWRSPKLMD